MNLIYNARYAWNIVKKVYDTVPVETLFESKHEYLVKKGLDNFKCLLDDLKSSKNTIK